MKQEKDSEQHKPATPEQIAEYQKLKARQLWIEYNSKRLDEIESNRLRLNRWIVLLLCVNLVSTLLILLL